MMALYVVVLGLNRCVTCHMSHALSLPPCAYEILTFSTKNYCKKEILLSCLVLALELEQRNKSMIMTTRMTVREMTIESKHGLH